MADLIQPVRGMNDVLPADAPLWDRVEGAAAELFAAYGYQRVRLPVLERTELFSRSIGELTDIVSKEMYTFEDRDGESVTLRPEATAGVVRAALEQRTAAQPATEALVQRPDVPAREAAEGALPPIPSAQRRSARLRRARDRRGADRALGAALEELGIKSVTLELNSIGTLEPRRLQAGARRALLAHRELLDEDSLRRLERNPLRILDSKNPALRELIDAAPLLGGYLDDESRAHFERVQQLLADVGVEFTLNPRLVRGLDYYSRTVFEWLTDRLGAQSAICSGGRYDGLVAQLGGRDTPAVGWALGIERIVEVLEVEGRAGGALEADAHLVVAGEAERRYGFKLAEQLRDRVPGVKLVDRRARRRLQGPAAPRRPQRRAVCADRRGERA